MPKERRADLDENHQRKMIAIFMGPAEGDWHDVDMRFYRYESVLGMTYHYRRQDDDECVQARYKGCKADYIIARAFQLVPEARAEARIRAIRECWHKIYNAISREEREEWGRIVNAERSRS
jgi:hypothetical protein